jgi:hypothetical protein
MQELPDFDSSLRDAGSRDRKYDQRPRTDALPEFERAQTVTLQIEVLRETYDDLLRTIVANEWEREEGLRTVLLTGLGYLDARLNLEGLSPDSVERSDADAVRRVDAMTRELAAYHSMYSVMKFKAFNLYKTNQALEFNVSGLRATDRMWEGWADRMRREHAQLQVECIRLRSLMSEFKLDWDQSIAYDTQALEQLEQPHITTPLLPRILTEGVARPEASHDEPPLPTPQAPPQPTLWEKIKAFFLSNK